MRSVYSLFMIVTLAVVTSLVLPGCLKDNVTRTYKILSPVLKPKQEVIAGIKSDAPRNIGAAGKIYLYGKYIFLNEVNKGVHVIDNSNPSKPVRKAFIDIPGNLDIAVKGHYLYADLFTDMITLDISDPANAKVVHVNTNVFPERQYGNNFSLDSSMVIIGWNEKDTTVNAETGNGGGFGCINCLSYDAMAFSATKAGTFVPGVAGSMARFAIVQQNLYAVNIQSLLVHDISDPSTPVAIHEQPIGWNIETIYPFRDKLFIGSSSGMFIYNISNLSNPVQEGQFNHATACDPVVADEQYAYVTLRTGRTCAGILNQLDVIDVKNVLSPSLVKSYPLTNPHGLALDGNTLFICDGSAGLKVFDVSDPSAMKMITQVGGLNTYDAIAWNGILYLVTEKSINQYDYSNPSSLKLLSGITLNR